MSELLEKPRFNYWEMENIDFMEDLSVISPSAWFEVDDYQDIDCNDCNDCDCSPK
jgi:hypothetical protein